MVRQVTVIDKFTREILLDTFSEKRPVSILFVGRNAYKDFISEWLLDNKLGNWFDPNPNTVAHNKGIVGVLAGVEIFTTQACDRELPVCVEGIYISYKSFENIEEFISDVNACIKI